MAPVLKISGVVSLILLWFEPKPWTQKHLTLSEKCESLTGVQFSILLVVQINMFPIAKYFAVKIDWT